MATVAGAEQKVTIVSETEKIGADDACLRWLQQKYPTLAVTHKGKAKVSLSAMENDVKACDALRWSRFSFPSDPHRPLSPNYNNETSNPVPVTAAVANSDSAKTGGGSDAGAITVAICNSEKSKGKAGNGVASVLHQTAFEAAPSRHFLREVVARRDFERQVNDSRRSSVTTRTEEGEEAPDQPRAYTRPFLGGYVAAPPHRDSFRLLIFPQQSHSDNCGSNSSGGASVTAAGPSAAVLHRRAMEPQEVPFYLRGSLDLHTAQDLKLNALNESDDDNGGKGLAARLHDATRFSLAASRKFPAPENAVAAAGHSLSGRAAEWARTLVSAAAVDVEVFTNHSRTERRYAPEKEKVERRKLIEDGAKVTVHHSNPRYSAAVATSLATVENSRFKNDSKRKSKDAEATPSSGTDDAILSFSLEDAYDSATQKIRPLSKSSGTYQLQWAAGPGIEYCIRDQRTTVFGKLSTESWAEWPFALFGRRFAVKLRNQSCLMKPLELITAGGGGGGGSDTAHEYLWATQGPKWNPKLLRGFDNDYSSIHHSRGWYSAFSVELTKKTSKTKSAGRTPAGESDADDGESEDAPISGTLFSNATAMAFVNACFVDTFREYPRASVGLSMASKIPRITVDPFNKFVPHKFECAFSWFVAFKDRQLLTGLQSPELPESMQYMRVSPVETFRHMKCGLTWKL